MGFRKFFSRRKEQNKSEDIFFVGTTVKNIKKDGKGLLKLNNPSDRMSYVKENCELILESNQQINEAKVEYQAVTSYLTDMQRIDMILPEQRETIEDAARKIINLTKERSKFQQKNSSFTDQYYRLFERYEMQIPKELPAIKESEKYQSVIQKDMEHLEKEKQSLLEEQEDIINRQSFLKGIAVTICSVIILLFIVFALLSNNSEANFTIPFLLTVLMGMASALYIFMEARRNFYNLKVVQMKLSREVILMNKVKIKSVNNRNYLDYAYSKYMVDNYNQLKTMWEEYVKIKDETRRYQSNTELLEFYNNELTHTLKKLGVVDYDIWIYQPTAIIDKKEMVEVRHRLNERRQKLRERIDMNSKQKEDALTTISSILITYPDCKEEAEKMMRKYRVQI